MARQLLKGLFALIRPFNCIMSAVTVPIIFLFLAGSSDLGNYQKEVFLGPLVVFLMCAGGNVLNDVVDLKIDRINKPARPIPSGMVTKRQAVIFSLLMFAGCVFVASQISRVVLIASIAGSLALAFYDMLSKSLGVLGNAIISLVIGSPYMVIGMITGETHKAAFLAIAAATITFGRELIKTIEDVKGDSVVGRFSLPAKYGKRKTMVIASLSIAFGSLSLIYLRAFYGDVYLFVILLAIYKFSGAIIQPVRMTTTKAGRLAKDIKTGSAITVLALALGSLF